LAQEYAARLESLPGWVWDPKAERWDQKIAQLGALAAVRGSVEVPEGTRFEDGVPVRTWIAIQRRAYAMGRMSEDRIRRLEALPGWAWDAIDAAWEANFELLARIAQETGTAYVAQDDKRDGRAVGNWSFNQRSAHARGKLDPSRAARLEELPGWTWAPRDARWDQHFAALAAWAASEGHARPAWHVEHDGIAIGKWVITVRSRYRRGTLTEEQKTRLDSLPGWAWKARDARWERGFEVLLRWVDAHGTALVPYGTKVDGFALGAWVTKQRSFDERGALDPDRRAALGALPGWRWDVHDEGWEAAYEALAQYREEEGQGLPPKGRRVNGIDVRAWVMRQVSAYKAGKLSRERTRRLEALPGWRWMGVHEASWEDHYEAVQEWVRQTGSASMPGKTVVNGKRIGAWTANQRSRRGRLSREQQERLERLPGWKWNSGI
jgi:hypothetical protein